jgi:hypothetical protein
LGTNAPRSHSSPWPRRRSLRKVPVRHLVPKGERVRLLPCRARVDNNESPTCVAGADRPAGLGFRNTLPRLTPMICARKGNRRTRWIAVRATTNPRYTSVPKPPSFYKKS